jgi:O-antigen ligase
MDLKNDYTRFSNWIFPILGLYPILKLNYSTPLLILFFVNVILKNKPKITTSSIKSVFLLTGYLGYFLISLFYSDDISLGVNEWIRLLPLLLIPFFIFFWNVSISTAEKTNFIKVFVFSNAVFCLLLLFFLGFFSPINDNVFNEISTRILSDYAEKIIAYKSMSGYSWLFIHKAYFSMNIIMALFLVFQLRLYKPIKFIIASLFVFVLLYSFSVPNILLLILASVIVGLKRWTKGSFIEKATLLLVASGIVLAITYKLNTRDINRAVVFANEFFDQNNSEGNDPRQAIYHAVKEVFYQYPMGVGIGSTQKELQKEYKYRIDSDSNELLFTEELNDDYWFKNNVTINKNALISPIKTENAEIFSTLPSQSEKGFSISKSIQIESSSEYTLSAYFKPEDNVIGILRVGDLVKGRVNVDFAKNKISYKGSEITNTLLKQEPDGWYRVAITTTLDIGDHNLLIGMTNTKQGYNMASPQKVKMGVWGIQLNKGKTALTYSRSTKDLYDYAYRNQLNTHNYFLHALLIGGPIALFLFLLFLVKMTADFYKRKSTAAVFFVVLLALNMLSENILFRHSGIFFVAVFMLFFYTQQSSLKYKESK